MGKLRIKLLIDEVEENDIAGLKTAINNFISINNL